MQPKQSMHQKFMDASGPIKLDILLNGQQHYDLDAFSPVGEFVCSIVIY
jgi:hypothetical protein